ncbi:hypothetical protein HJ590_14240 [Naumannella sp. ID2617S]|nr:hypothetical protein [Naumannella sp. ID2617S]
MFRYFAALPLLLVAACAGQSGPGAAPTAADPSQPATPTAGTSPTVSASPTASRDPALAAAPAMSGDQLCSLLTDAQASEGTGLTVEKHRGSSGVSHEASCSWYTAKGEFVTTSISILSFTVPATTQMEKWGVTLADKKSPSPGVGDQSYYLVGGYNTNAGVVFAKGTNIFNVGVTAGDPNKRDEPADRALALARAKQILDKVP